jgi:hypothetical protein
MEVDEGAPRFDDQTAGRFGELYVEGFGFVKSAREKIPWNDRWGVEALPVDVADLEAMTSWGRRIPF